MKRTRGGEILFVTFLISFPLCFLFNEHNILMIDAMQPAAGPTNSEDSKDRHQSESFDSFDSFSDHETGQKQEQQHDERGKGKQHVEPILISDSSDDDSVDAHTQSVIDRIVRGMCIYFLINFVQLGSRQHLFWVLKIGFMNNNP